MKRKLVNSYDDVNTVLVQALSDEITQLDLQIGVVKAELDEIDETRSSFVLVSAQIDESLGLVSLIEKRWKDEDYAGLRRSLRVLIKEVDIKSEGAHIVLRPLVVLDKAGYDNRGGTSPN
jgi:hypothetical protein